MPCEYSRRHNSQTSPTVYNNSSIRGIAVDNRANYRLMAACHHTWSICPLEDKDASEALKGALRWYYGFQTRQASST